MEDLTRLPCPMKDVVQLMINTANLVNEEDAYRTEHYYEFFQMGDKYHQRCRGPRDDDQFESPVSDPGDRLFYLSQRIIGLSELLEDHSVRATRLNDRILFRVSFYLTWDAEREWWSVREPEVYAMSSDTAPLEVM